ncbi:MAG: hypothetical protein TECD_00387 [Hyphomicrobiaceae bacterium hypho_1]
MIVVAPTDNDGETPVNPYSLLEAIKRSSDTAHTGCFIFLSLMAYLMIIVAGVSHEDLLLEKDIQLPIIVASIPLLQFFKFAPILFLLIHLSLLLQIVLLARKTLEFDISLQELEPTTRRTHPLRLELHNFFFIQSIAGPHRNFAMSLLLHFMSWLTFAILPIALILFIQLSFLPYHNILITWIHRIVLIVDISMLILLGVFMTRVEPNFFKAAWRMSLLHPISVISTALIVNIIVLFSFFVATIPGEELDKAVRQYVIGQGIDAKAFDDLVSKSGFLSPILSGETDGSRFSLFYRNLLVSDLDLIMDNKSNRLTPSLRGRDLRFARLDRSNLHQADMTGANLDGASLISTDLSGVRLTCHNEADLMLGLGREQAKCASARGANFTNAQLQGTLLTGLDLSNANLKNAQIQNSILRLAILKKTNFWNANLQKADLSAGIQAQGANFSGAKLEGANLDSGQLQFADFTNAQLQGSTLKHARLQGAVFQNANLSAANFRRAGLQAADMTGSILNGADMRLAGIWMTLPPSLDKIKLSNMSNLQIQPLNDIDQSKLKKVLELINRKKLQHQILDRVQEILSKKASATWNSSDDITNWKSLITYARPENTMNYRKSLTSFLETLACQEKWKNGSVTEGIVRRAIQKQFLGDKLAIYSRLTADKKCEPATKVSSSLIQTLSSIINTRLE